MERVREIQLIPLGQCLPLAEIRRIAYSVARHIGARVVAVLEPSVTPNFHAVTLDESTFRDEVRRIYLLYSGDYDAWAVVLPREPILEPNDDGSHLYEPRFLDHDGIAVAMADLHGITVWSADDLSMPAPADLPLRVPGDMAYWQPKRLGDALFNWWD
ncbi:hypothetical protein ABIE09_004604 [Lysobacter enzymogenes]|uniref:hypothetical protein n=1 Tax=Lysobacter enzymogenes TaxID=69 RepID=UPI00339A7677